MPKKKIDIIYCATDCCESVASYKTGQGMPLCSACAQCYELGQNNPDEPLTVIEPRED